MYKKLTLSDSTYEGDVVNNMLHGKGVIKYNNGIIYKGGFFGSTLTGDCEITFANGNKYSGFAVNGGIYGKGTIEYFGGGSYYRGNLINNKITGYGEFTFPHGVHYKGYSLNNQYHFYGEYSELLYSYKGYQQYPLLWDNEFNCKPAFDGVLEAALEAKEQ